MANQISSYLKQLSWDHELEKSSVFHFLSNIRLTLLLIGIIIAGGIFALINLPRRINPEVNLPIVFITTIYPGAGPSDVESQVTDPLETAIRGVPGLNRYSSSSSENVSNIVIEFTANTNADKAKTDVQAAVDTITGLPAAVLEPRVLRLDFEDIPVLTFAISTTSDPVALINFAQQLHDDLEDLPEIENVVMTGFEEPEINVFLESDTLKSYALNPALVSQSLQAALTTVPGGFVQTNSLNLPISVEKSDPALEVIRSLPLNFADATYHLGDLAVVSLKSAPNQPESYLGTNQTPALRAITFSVFKAAGADLETSAQVAGATVEEAIKPFQDKFALSPITDFAQDIQDQFGDLVVDFGTSVLLVFLTLLIFLGIRQAGIASLVIPLSFFATFATMYVFDIELSFLSLFSLLLGLGMIVDDTIVMISAITDYYGTGKFTPAQTGMLVWRDYLAPTLSSNLTNIWSFLPLLIASGIIGEFTKVISIVVTVALVTSTIIALTITIPMMIAVLNPPRPKTLIKLTKWLLLPLPIILYLIILPLSPWVALLVASYGLFLLIARLSWPSVQATAKRRLHSLPQPKGFSRSTLTRLKTNILGGFVSTRRLIRSYKRFLDRVLVSKRAKRQTLFAVVSIAVFSYLLVPLGFVENEFFPKTDEGLLYLSVSMPTGTTLSITQAEGLNLLNQVRLIPEVDYVLLDVGVAVDFTTVSSSQIDESLIRLSIKLKDDRELTSAEVANVLREQYRNYTQGELQVVEVTGGPPTGADIQLTLTGDDLTVLEDLAGQAKSYLESMEGTTNVALSVKPGTSKIAFDPDMAQLNRYRLSLPELGFLIRLFTSGQELTSVELATPECADSCPVILRTQSLNFPAAELPSLSVTTPQGENLPLSSLGSFTLSPNPTQINHLDGQRTLSVQASVLPGYNPIELGNQALTYVQTEINTPEGYTWQAGGANEENSASVNSILQAMILAAILIMGTMVIELKSFKRALIVMMAIPLAISGVFIVFALTGTPLSFPALIGILALFGIVVKNSIMIVDKINRNLAINLPFTEALSDGASSRLEPILFSSATNIIGLLPITLSDPLWRGLGGAIIAGLTMSGLIMLVFIPVVFDLWYRTRYSTPQSLSDKVKA